MAHFAGIELLFEIGCEGERERWITHTFPFRGTFPYFSMTVDRGPWTVE